MLVTIILIGVAVITACAVNIKPSKAADEPTAAPTILDGATPEYTGTAQKIVTDLPAGMRYYITTEQIDPTTIDAGKIVPVGYTALDFIECTGTQCIDTGVLVGDNTRVVIDWKFNSMRLQQRIFGVTPRNDYFGFEVYINSSSRYGYSFREVSWNSAGVAVNLLRHVVDFNAYENTLKIDNGLLVNQKLSNSAGNFDRVALSLYLFAVSGAIEYGEYAIGNAYSCQMYEKGVLQRDFVPVRADNGTLGMYDLANDKFYQNDGTGEFIPGDEVNITIKDWEWLDSVDDEQNNVTLQANTKYYVYYYTPNTDTTTVTPLAVKEFYVNCTNHVYGEWQTTTPATCTTEGVREHTCTGCGHTESEVIPATGHNYQSTFDQTTGTTTFTCTVCQNSYEKECDGQHNHEFIDNEVKPKCETIGYTSHICKYCNYKYQDNYLPALGHNYGTWTTTEPATTEHAGEQKRTCEHCGAEQVRTIPALAGTTTDGGKDNTAPLLWGIIIGVIAVLAGCGGLAWLLIVLFKPKKKEKVAAA